MAATGLLALIDDISTLLDDVAILTKVAAKKTAGVLGDDLALNAEQVSGVRAERELPVVWAVAKGSAINKLILVPAALLLSAFAPWGIMPLLMLGGGFLCFEGFEKIIHKLLHKQESIEQDKQIMHALTHPEVDLLEVEQTKIKGAIRTDFILSAEIVVIALGTVKDAVFIQQALVVAALAAGITVGVYGLVAGIVKLDDAGLHLMRREGQQISDRFKQNLGKTILKFCPYLMKGLSILGTAAMFLVGGGILLHGIPLIYESVHHLNQLPGLAAFPESVLTILWNALMGLGSGAVLVCVIEVSKRLSRRLFKHKH